MKKADVLEAASSIVVDRNASYGDVRENFQRIADFWNVWLRQRGLLARGQVLEPRDVAMLNDLQKNARLVQTFDHEDSIVDKAGYAAVYGECVHVLVGETIDRQPPVDPVPSHGDDTIL